MPLRVVALVLCLVAAVGASACDHGVDLPSASSTAASFLHALARGDAAEMMRQATPETAVAPKRLQRWLRDLLAGGAITSLKARTTGSPDQPSSMPNPTPTPPPTSEVPYQLVIVSEAARRPVRLDGRLALRYETGAGRWAVRWDRSILFPGYPRARAYEASFNYLRRGRILDRSKRVLAAGTGPRRHYPFGALGGSLIGAYGPVTQESLADYPGHDVGDLVGTAGLEEAFNDRLEGKPAGRLTIVGRGGRVLARIGRRAGRAGRDVRTTLDMSMEKVVADALGSTVGGAVVLDPKSGGVLAAVASSPFDPNNYVGVSGVQPFDRALAGLYPPGSAMKVVTSAAALDTGVVTPTTVLTGPKEFRGVHNFHGEHFATLTFTQALEFSVNTTFAQVALKLGSKRFMHYVNAFGFNHNPGVPGAATSSVPDIKDSYDLMFSAFGQAQVLATPLEMASVVQTVAHNGVRMTPHITPERPTHRRVIKVKTARTLTSLMERVVESGTGVKAQIPGVAVAGKTGTAEVDTAAGRKNHAWFVAFAPAAAPRLAVSVVAEYGGVGGTVAAPIARAILEGALGR